MSVNLKALQQMQYISLGGYHEHFEFQCTGPIPPNMSHIYITSFFTPIKYSGQMTYLPCGARHIYCYAFLMKTSSYYAYGNYMSYYTDKENTHYSWSMADEFCRDKSMVLPFFMSRDELDEFIRSLKLALTMRFTEAVFIGLRYDKTKVCLNSVNTSLNSS